MSKKTLIIIVIIIALIAIGATAGYNTLRQAPHPEGAGQPITGSEVQESEVAPDKEGVNKLGGKELTPQIENPSDLCASEDINAKRGCYEAVAMYNNDLEICNKIDYDIWKKRCKESISAGELMYRHYVKGMTGCTEYTNPPDFEENIRICKNWCEKYNMKYLSLPTYKSPTSETIYRKCKDGKLFFISSCYCY